MRCSRARRGCTTKGLNRTKSLQPPKNRTKSLQHGSRNKRFPYNHGIFQMLKTLLFFVQQDEYDEDDEDEYDDDDDEYEDEDDDDGR